MSPLSIPTKAGSLRQASRIFEKYFRPKVNLEQGEFGGARKKNVIIFLHPARRQRRSVLACRAYAQAGKNVLRVRQFDREDAARAMDLPCASGDRPDTRCEVRNADEDRCQQARRHGP